MSTSKTSFMHSKPSHRSNLCLQLNVRTSVMMRIHTRCRLPVSREDHVRINLKSPPLIEGNGMMIRIQVQNSSSHHNKKKVWCSLHSSSSSSRRSQRSHLNNVKSINRQLAPRKTNRKFRWTINHSLLKEISNNQLDVLKKMQLSGQSPSNNQLADRKTQMNGRNLSNNQCNFYKSSFKEALSPLCSLITWLVRNPRKIKKKCREPPNLEK